MNAKIETERRNIMADKKPLTIYSEILRRRIFLIKEVEIEEIRTKERTKKELVFAEMKEEDIEEMCEIHNEAWGADKIPSVGLTISKFVSQFENSKLFCALLLNHSADGIETIRVGGINPLRINAKISMSGEQPRCWFITSEDDIPLSWDECTNFGTYSTHAVEGVDLYRIWPCADGDTIVCPTIYRRQIITINGQKYKMPPIAGGLLTTVMMYANEIAEKEGRSIKLIAYSAPRDFEYHWKVYMEKGGIDIPIEEYLTSTSAPRGALSYETYKKMTGGVSEDAWAASMYGIYRNNGGVLTRDEFDRREIYKFMTAQIGRKVYRDYIAKFGPTGIEQFLFETARDLLDSVINMHIKNGAKIGKLIPNGRIDPKARNWNVIMVYPTAMPPEKNEEKELFVKSESETAII